MTIEEIKAVFGRVGKNLQKETWFKGQSWLFSAHEFPTRDPDGVTFHVFKKNWFNDDGRGIHIEAYLDLTAAKRKKSPLTIHLLHHDFLPGTRIKRVQFSKPVVDRVYGTISNWDGYRFRTGRYGVQPFTKTLNALDDDYERSLQLEVERLCKVWGPVVDEVLSLLSSPEM